MPPGLVAIDPNHPLISQEYAVYTRSIDEMAVTIGNWVDQRQPGGYIHGPSRFGKSRGVKWFLREALADRFGEDSPLPLMARSNSPTRGHPKFPQAGRPDYDDSGLTAMRAAASFRR